MSKELNKAPVEQAGGDERAAFELFVRKHCGMPAHIAVNWDAKFTNDAWAGWQARAALAQPSPAHPAPVEQVGGDERAAFEAAFAAMGRPVCRADYDQDAYGTPFDDGGWTGWQARAALAQPSPTLPPFAEKVLAKLRRFYDCAEDFESGGVDIGRHWLDLLTQLGLLNRVQRSPALWEISQQGEDLLGTPHPSPAPADEKPGDSILCSGCFAKGVGPEHFDEAGKCLVRQQTEPLGAEFAQVLSDNLPELLSTAQAEQAEAERPEVVAWRYGFSGGIVSDKACLDEWKSGGEYQSLMTVAQHERIVGALRAERDGAIKLLGQSVWQKIERLTQERDAALARVAELERGKVYVEARRCDECQHGGINDSATGVAACHECDWTGPEPEEDKCPGCQRENCMAAACPQCGARYVLVASEEIAAPVAQAQHSVPAYVSYTTRPAESLAGIALRQLKDESRWVEIRDINAHAFPDMQSHSYYPAGTVIKLPSPSNPIPQAWLDVQAERRRQVEAEGWTPEHDDEHNGGELADAAACYALWAGGINPGNWREFWPWAPEWLKHSEPRRMLVKAAALILAEIQRLDRAAAAGKEVGHE
ncbi:LysM peptidoglycan-binding domain-containing protein [Pseudomonas aeruginosa]